MDSKRKAASTATQTAKTANREKNGKVIKVSFDVPELIGRLRELESFSNYNMTDMDSARLFGDVFKDSCRYCTTFSDWAFYDGRRWQVDNDGLHARTAAKHLARALAFYAPEAAHSDEESKSFLSYVKKWTGARYRDMIVRDSRDVHFFGAEQLDKNDFLLNVENGVLQFEQDGSVHFLDHSPDLLLSKLAHVSYKPDARCERWDAFISEIMQGDRSKIEYLQKVAGLCLTGDHTQEKMWFLYGRSTRNGKSTFVETLKYLLGDYVDSIAPETLARRDNSDSRSASPDVAKLKGIRLAVCSEPRRSMPLNNGLVKNLTGYDSITARQLYERELTFRPVCKLLCNTNFLPVASDPTVFASDRIVVLTFDRHFTEQERDVTLKGHFQEPDALAGILNWCIDGWRLYRQDGLSTPTVVKESINEYALEEDRILQFLHECMEKSDKKNGNTAIKQAYSIYRDWCQQNGLLHPLTKQAFVQDLKDKGLFADRGTCGKSQCRNILKGYIQAQNFQEPEEPTPFDD